jgi:hypothetical protein
MVFLDTEGLSKRLGGRGGITLVAELLRAGGILARSVRYEEVRRRGVDLDPEILLQESPPN